ncbi:MAG: LamB/YcsF family protein [Actinomycetes bacterium]
MTATVDLNSDLGESFGAWRLGDDVAILNIVTSANVACGFHAGDPLTIERTVTAAAERGVRVGAQVSYPDLVGFGRRRMDVPPDQLTADVLYQIAAVAGFCRAAGTRLSYVKPHGALYNRIVDDEEQARAVCQAITRYSDGLSLLTLPHSTAAAIAESVGLTVVFEGFADRAYTSEGRLVPRTEPGAVIADPVSVAAHAIELATSGTVQSICLHGDTPGAVSLAQATRQSLEQAGIAIEAFA